MISAAVQLQRHGMRHWDIFAFYCGELREIRTSQIVAVVKDMKSEILLSATAAVADNAGSALAASVQNSHADEMARIAHILSYPGAAHLISVTRSAMEWEHLDVVHFGHDSAKL